MSSPPNPFIMLLSDELLVEILTYLRAVDLVFVREVSKRVFPRQIISDAVNHSLAFLHKWPLPLSPSSSNLDVGNCVVFDRKVIRLPDILYAREIKSLINAISGASPPIGKGYWISSSWLANAKKYYDTLVLPVISEDGPSRSTVSSGKKSNRKKTIRNRKGSDALPPWPCMNADILCKHGCLALTKGPGAKRKVIGSRNWNWLRRFYPGGPQFKYCDSIECGICMSGNDDKKVQIADR